MIDDKPYAKSDNVHAAEYTIPVRKPMQDALRTLAAQVAEYNTQLKRAGGLSAGEVLALTINYQERLLRPQGPARETR